MTTRFQFAISNIYYRGVSTRNSVLGQLSSPHPMPNPVKNWGVAKGSSISWVAKFKGDENSECKLSNGWSRSYREIKMLLSAEI